MPSAANQESRHSHHRRCERPDDPGVVRSPLVELHDAQYQRGCAEPRQHHPNHVGQLGILVGRRFGDEAPAARTATPTGATRKNPARHEANSMASAPSVGAREATTPATVDHTPTAMARRWGRGWT